MTKLLDSDGNPVEIGQTYQFDEHCWISDIDLLIHDIVSNPIETNIQFNYTLAENGDWTSTQINAEDYQLKLKEPINEN